MTASKLKEGYLVDHCCEVQMEFDCFVTGAVVHFLKCKVKDIEFSRPIGCS